MKKQHLFLVLLVMLMFVTGAYLWHHRKSDSGDQQPQPPQNEGTSQSPPPSPPPQNAAAESQVPLIALPVEIAKRVAAEQKWASRNNGPVAFYAKVIDQAGNPVEDVVLSGTLNIFDEGFFVDDKNRVKNVKLTILSDSRGNLDLKKDKGSTFRVEHLGKDGYVWQVPLGLGSFDFASMNRPKQSPDYKDPNRRFVFHVWKKGETKPTIQISKRLRLEETDNEFAINILSIERGAENISTPDLRIKFRYISPNDPTRQYDRQMVIEAPTGGLLETLDTYTFLAPENQYARQYNCVVRPDDMTSGGWKRKFYLKSRDGRLYAGLEVQATLFPHVIDISAIVNPTGSRNLEPDPAKLITDPEEIRRLDEQTRVK